MHNNSYNPQSTSTALGSHKTACARYIKLRVFRDYSELYGNFHTQEKILPSHPKAIKPSDALSAILPKRGNTIRETFKRFPMRYFGMHGLYSLCVVCTRAITRRAADLSRVYAEDRQGDAGKLRHQVRPIALLASNARLATAAAAAGVSDGSIQKQTGHKSRAMLDRYIRSAELFKDNAAGVVGL